MTAPQRSTLSRKPPASTRHETILITGGAGFIGTNVAAHLLGNGYRVRILDNMSRRHIRRNVDRLNEAYGEALEVRIGDVRDRDMVREAMRGVSHVFHFAAQVAVTTSVEQPWDDFTTNLLGTLTVLEAARRAPHPPSLIFTSTNKVYGQLEDLAFEKQAQRYQPVSAELAARGIGESRPLDFHSPYGCSKGAADQYVIDYARIYGLRTAVFRMSCIYGPHQYGTEDQGWVAHFLIRALQNQPLTIYGDGCQVRDLLFVEDLVQAFMLAWQNIDRISGQAFNIGGGVSNTISLRELLDQIEQLLRVRPQVEFAPWRPGDQVYYVTDTSKFEASTGWQRRVGVEAGLGRLQAWLAREIPLLAVEGIGAKIHEGKLMIREIAG